MLDDQQLEWLCAQLALTAEALGHAVSPAAAAMMASDLSSYAQPVLQRALTRVRSEHSGKLTLKVILDRLEALAGRMAPNEAWSLALQAQDEAVTVVWTDEIQQAWVQARQVLHAGDKIGARMTFIAAYERITALAREQRQLPAPVVSIGWDGAQRAAALERAVTSGLLTHEHAAEYSDTLALPAPAFSPLALLAGRVEVTTGAPPELRERLGQLRDYFARRSNRFTRQQVVARAERMRLGQAKRQTAKAVQAYQQGAQA